MFRGVILTNTTMIEMSEKTALWDFAWWATHCNLSKLLIAAKVEAQALKQVYPVEYPIAPPQ